MIRSVQIKLLKKMNDNEYYMIVTATILNCNHCLDFQPTNHNKLTWLYVSVFEEKDEI